MQGVGCGQCGGGGWGVGEGGVGLWCVCHFGLSSFQLQIASTPQQSADLSFAPGWVLGPGQINMAEASVICLSSRSAWLGLDGVIHKKKLRNTVLCIAAYFSINYVHILVDAWLFRIIILPLVKWQNQHICLDYRIFQYFLRPNDFAFFENEENNA